MLASFFKLCIAQQLEINPKYSDTHGWNLNLRYPTMDGFIMEKPTKMDDLGVQYPYFRKHPHWHPKKGSMDIFHQRNDMPNRGVWAPQANSQSSMSGLESTTWVDGWVLPYREYHCDIHRCFITHFKRHMVENKISYTNIWDDTSTNPHLASKKSQDSDIFWKESRGTFLTVCRSMASSQTPEDERIRLRELHACATFGWIILGGFFRRLLEKNFAKLKFEHIITAGVNLRVMTS